MIVRIEDTTDSTSITTGSIQTDGGLGIAKSLFVGEGAIINAETQDFIVNDNTADLTNVIWYDRSTKQVLLGGSVITWDVAVRDNLRVVGNLDVGSTIVGASIEVGY